MTIPTDHYQNGHIPGSETQPKNLETCAGDCVREDKSGWVVPTIGGAGGNAIRVDFRTVILRLGSDNPGRLGRSVCVLARAVGIPAPGARNSRIRLIQVCGVRMPAWAEKVVLTM